MDFVAKLNKLFDNKNFIVAISIFLGVYGALLAPALPNSVVLFFDSWFGKLLFLFIIAYVSSRNVQVALLIAVVFLITLQVANRRVMENFEDSPTFMTDDTKIKQTLCKWVETLSVVSEPKKDEIADTLTSIVLEKHAMDLTKLDNTLSIDQIKNYAKSKEVGETKVSQFCSISSNESTDSTEKFVDTPTAQSNKPVNPTKKPKQKKQPSNNGHPEEEPSPAVIANEAQKEEPENNNESVEEENIEKFTSYSSYNVLPANNNSGNPKFMYAPLDVFNN